MHRLKLPESFLGPKLFRRDQFVRWTKLKQRQKVFLSNNNKTNKLLPFFYQRKIYLLLLRVRRWLDLRIAYGFEYPSRIFFVSLHAKTKRETDSKRVKILNKEKVCSVQLFVSYWLRRSTVLPFSDEVFDLLISHFGWKL